MNNLIPQNELQCLLVEAVKICKEKSYYELKEQLSQSFQGLIRVEAECRRDKVSSIIRGIQKIDKEQFLLEKEYEKILSITNVSAIYVVEGYIDAFKDYRRSLVQEKKRLENMSR